MVTQSQVENLLSGMVVVVDTREQRPYGFPNMGVMTTTATLSTGDYSIRGFEDQVAIERKEYGDFLSSTTRHRSRFMGEMVRLSCYRFKALVIEADYSSIVQGLHPHSKVTPSSAVGSIVKIVSMGIPVVTAWDRKSAEDFTIRLLKRSYLELRLPKGE